MTEQKPVIFDGIDYTEEQLDELSIITDNDIQIAHRQIIALLDKRFKNILLTEVDEIEDA